MFIPKSGNLLSVTDIIYRNLNAVFVQSARLILFIVFDIEFPKTGSCLKNILLMKKLLVAAFLLTGMLSLHAEDDGRISPLYFGPNALPVPDMLDGTVSEKIYAEVSYDFYKGFYGDRTQDINVKLNIPLFTPRVNLSVWMPVIEFYHNTPRSLAHQASPEQKVNGKEFGNVYVSTDIHVFRQKTFTPDVTLRIGLITASGDSEQYARYFDAPGYFFDTSIAKSLKFENDFFKELRLAANLGFLCWQVTTNSQNDAYMYGLKTVLDTKAFSASFAWQGYSGWIDDGDKPMVLKADITGNIGRFRPLLAYQYGLRDYPFHQFRIGLGYMF